MGIFILGSLFSFTNSFGVIAGALFGFIAGSWISLGANLLNPNYPKIYSSTEFCNYTNLTSYDLYENTKEQILQANKYNSTIFANGKRATNLEGFNVFFLEEKK